MLWPGWDELLSFGRGAPALYLLAERDRTHQNAGGLHEYPNFSLRPLPLFLFLLLDFFPIPLVQVSDPQVGVQAGFWVTELVEFPSPFRCAVGRTDGHHAEMLLPLQGAGSAASTAARGIVCAWMAASFLSIWKKIKNCINLCNNIHVLGIPMCWGWVCSSGSWGKPCLVSA